MSTTRYDALNRAIAVTAPDGSIYRPSFNEANLLQAVDLNLRGVAENGSPVWTPFVRSSQYDAKGQRTICCYANGLETIYTYDAETFRLLQLRTIRATSESGRSMQIFKDPTTLQDLHYTYDPVGNMIRMKDGALKKVFHANQQVDTACEYSYDSIYRLVEAKGREHTLRHWSLQRRSLPCNAAQQHDPHRPVCRPAGKPLLLRMWRRP